MAGSTSKSSYWRGVLMGLPFVLVIVPFALLFGVVATEAGLNLAQTMAFSVVVIAGASQFTALQLMTENAPVVLILATALTVNLRMAMYSASLQPWIGQAPFWQRSLVAYMTVDQVYSASILEYEQRPGLSVAERVAFFFGVATPVVPLWYLCTWLGAGIGDAVPEALALDFALPITFIAMMGPLLRTLAHVATALTSVVVSLALAGLPAGTGLLIAAGLAMGVGALVDAARTRT